jgi:hypothetical protein
MDVIAELTPTQRTILLWRLAQVIKNNKCKNAKQRKQKQRIEQLAITLTHNLFAAFAFEFFETRNKQF